jgi:hypothetical protein
MVRTLVIGLLVVSATIAFGQSPEETDWQPALAYGGAPDCPQHVGRRVSYSATVALGSATVQIVGTAEHKADGKCSSQVSLVVHAPAEKTIPLSIPKAESYEIADFSPDGRSFLMAWDKTHEPPVWKQTRDIDVAVVDVARPEIEPRDVWDLYGWDDCEATIEPQGFTRDGRVMLLARPSTSAGQVRNDCVPDWGLYATDLKSRPVRLPDDTKIPRFGKVRVEEHQACKADPDIVEACFTIHGRLHVWNGSPSLRIWHVGTKRMLGVLDDFPLPESLDSYDLLNGELWGDFEVCPFAKDRPGAMRMVCVESASRLSYKKD